MVFVANLVQLEVEAITAFTFTVKFAIRKVWILWNLALFHTKLNINHSIQSQGCFSTYSPGKPADTKLLAALFRRVLDSLVASEQLIHNFKKSLEVKIKLLLSAK